MKENLLLPKDLLETSRIKPTSMTLTSENVYVHQLGDILKNYNNAYYRTIKMKHVDVKSKT